MFTIPSTYSGLVSHTHNARDSLLSLGQPLHYFVMPIGKLYVLRASTLIAGPVA